MKKIAQIDHKTLGRRKCWSPIAAILLILADEMMFVQQLSTFYGMPSLSRLCPYNLIFDVSYQKLFILQP